MNGKGWWFGVSMLAAMFGCDAASPSVGVNAGGSGGGNSLKSVLPIVAGICTLATGCDLSLVDPGAQHGFVIAPGWSVPECEGIDGAPGLSMTLDLGESFVPTLDGIEQPEKENAWQEVYPYTGGLVALRERANTLFAIQHNSVVVSKDGGCNWAYHPESLNGQNFWLGQYDGIQMHDAGDGVVYAHGTQEQLIRITDDSIDVHDMHVTFDLNGTSGNKGWQNIRGMTTLNGSPNSLRAVTHSGWVVESHDGGENWYQTDGMVAPPSDNIYLSPGVKAYFDDSDWDRILLHLGGTVRFTDDGGETWENSDFEGNAGAPLLIQSILPSPTDFDVVWALALQMEPGTPIADQTRLYRSTDAGRNFAVVGDGSEFPITMGGSLRPVPQRNAEVLIVQETEVLRINAVMRSVSVHPLEAPVVVTAFSPADNDVLYLGFNAGQYWADTQ